MTRKRELYVKKLNFVPQVLRRRRRRRSTPQVFEIERASPTSTTTSPLFTIIIFFAIFFEAVIGSFMELDYLDVDY